MYAEGLSVVYNNLIISLATDEPLPLLLISEFCLLPFCTILPMANKGIISLVCCSLHTCRDCKAMLKFTTHNDRVPLGTVFVRRAQLRDDRHTLLSCGGASIHAAGGAPGLTAAPAAGWQELPGPVQVLATSMPPFSAITCGHTLATTWE